MFSALSIIQPTKFYYAQRFFVYLLIFSIIFIVSNINFSGSVFSKEINYFVEDFDSLESSRWEVYENSGEASIQDGVLFLTSNGISFPYLFSKLNPFPAGDFGFEIKFKYPYVYWWGVGFSLSVFVPNNNSTVEEVISHGNDAQMFFVWQDLNRHFHVSTRNCFACAKEVTDFIILTSPELNEHILKIDYIGQKYFVYLDGVNIYSSEPINKTPAVIWIGNPTTITTPDTRWTELEIDYIRVNKYLDSAKILLLPGLGGSWCREGIIYNRPCEQWTATPYNKIYDNFRQTMLAAGYTQDQDYFEFYYDWRKPIDNIADDFKAYLGSKSLVDGSEKVKLVGHSLGGLVARTYMQKYGAEEIDKLITVGSPHEGVLEAYRAWEGGETGDHLSWGSIAADLLVHIHKGIFQTKVEAVRKLAPSLKDLLPIFDFLKDENNNPIPVGTLHQYNQFLADLKTNLSLAVKSLLSVVYGKDQGTDEYYKVKKPNFLDKLFGRWEDGRPVVFERTTAGDNTVLIKSARLTSVPSKALAQDHAGLIHTGEGLNAILSALDLDGISPVLNTNVPPTKPSILFFLRSPVNLKVSLPDGSQAGNGIGQQAPNSWYFENEGLLVIFNAQQGKYTAILEGSGEGLFQDSENRGFQAVDEAIVIVPEGHKAEQKPRALARGSLYHLDVGQITENGTFWQEIKEETKPGEIDQFVFDFSSGVNEDGFLSDPTGLQFIQLSKIRLKYLKDYIGANLAGWRKTTWFLKLDLLLKSLDEIEASDDANSRSVLTKGAIFLLFDARRFLPYTTQEVRTYGNNEFVETEFLLSQAWLAFWNQGDLPLSAKLTEKMISKNDQQVNKLKSKLAEKAESGPNPQLAGLYELALTKNEKAKSSFQEKSLAQAWLSAQTAKLYLDELARLLK